LGCITGSTKYFCISYLLSLQQKILNQISTKEDKIKVKVFSFEILCSWSLTQVMSVSKEVMSKFARAQRKISKLRDSGTGCIATDWWLLDHRCFHAFQSPTFSLSLSRCCKNFWQLLRRGPIDKIRQLGFSWHETWDLVDIIAFNKLSQKSRCLST